MGGPLAVVAVARWFVGLIGLARLLMLRYRMWRGAVVPVRGPRLLQERLPIRLPDLTGRSGTFRHMRWAGVAGGVACRASASSLAVGECRPDGDHARFEVRVPIDYLLTMGGAIGFFVALGLASIGSSNCDARGWADGIPFLLALGALGQAIWQVTHARRVGVLLARYMPALADDLARPPG